jgi:hypothetical protein
MVSLQQDFADGSYIKKQCPAFNGEHGIKVLFYVEERFCKLTEHNFLWAGDGPDLFANFEEVLVDMALTKWENINDPQDSGRTQYPFILCSMLAPYIEEHENEEAECRGRV